MIGERKQITLVTFFMELFWICSEMTCLKHSPGTLYRAGTVCGDLSQECWEVSLENVLCQHPHPSPLIPLTVQFSSYTFSTGFWSFTGLTYHSLSWMINPRRVLTFREVKQLHDEWCLRRQMEAPSATSEGLGWFTDPLRAFSPQMKNG